MSAIFYACCSISNPTAASERRRIKKEEDAKRSHLVRLAFQGRNNPKTHQANEEGEKNNYKEKYRKQKY